MSKTRRIKIVKVHSEIEALLLEANYIKKHQPFYNLRLTDGKAYPLIKITIKDKFPKVLISRRPNDSNSVYFGPYPNAGAMKSVLKTVRKIFPFQSVPNHSKKTCLYYHLGLCPCPPAFDSPILQKQYKKNIKYLISFLNGDSTKILKELEKERNQLSKNEKYEQAALIQEKITSIKLITSSAYKLFDEEIDPNLKVDEINNRLVDLSKQLNAISSGVNSLKRIECYDISNIQGKFAVGSMTVFINGVKDTSLYRKFKIKYTKDEPNDFAMLREVLLRRFSRSEWPYPDLIVVDGGKGQVSTGVKVLDEKKLQISLIGLAKKDEIIITSALKEIRLPKDSKALHLIMGIRDEAHRFAINYHRSLRAKYLLIS